MRLLSPLLMLKLLFSKGDVMINIERMSNLLAKEFGSGSYSIIGWEDEYCIHDLTMHTRFSANFDDHIDNIKDLPSVIDAEDRDLQLRSCICEMYGE